MSEHRYDGTLDYNEGVAQEARQRRLAARRVADRTVPEVMADWSTSRNRRRARVAREYWDAYESGRPMSDDDY